MVQGASLRLGNATAVMLSWMETWRISLREQVPTEGEVVS